MTAKKPTLNQFKQWARDNAPLASAALAAQAFAECERERVAAYILPILARYDFKVTDRYKDRDAGQTITNTRDLYLCDDEPGLQAFYADCDTAHRAHGFTGPEGHCPALVAEHLQSRAESALIDAAEPLFGFGSSDVYGDDRKRALELLIGACVQTGLVTNIFKKSA